MAVVRTAWAPIDTERDADVDEEVGRLVALREAEIKRQQGAIKLYKEFAWLATTLRDYASEGGIKRLVKVREELIALGMPVPFDPAAGGSA